MDAKSRVNFINSVVNGVGVPCPVCNSLNEPDAKFCKICGTQLNYGDAGNKKQSIHEIITCPVCNTMNVKASEYCVSCGTKLIAIEDSGDLEPDADNMVVCPFCNSINTAEASFCFACGGALGQFDNAEKLSESVDYPPVNTSEESTPTAETVNEIINDAPAEEAVSNNASDMPFHSIIDNSMAGTNDAAVNEQSQLAFAQTTLTVERSTDNAAAFASVDNPEREKNSDYQPFNTIPQNSMKSEERQDIFSPEVASTVEPEEVSVFAQGLPDWDIVPPQVVVRRKKK